MNARCKEQMQSISVRPNLNVQGRARVMTRQKSVTESDQTYSLVFNDDRLTMRSKTGAHQIQFSTGMFNYGKKQCNLFARQDFLNI